MFDDEYAHVPKQTLFNEQLPPESIPDSSKSNISLGAIYDEYEENSLLLNDYRRKILFKIDSLKSSRRIVLPHCGTQ